MFLIRSNNLDYLVEFIGLAGNFTAMPTIEISQETLEALRHKVKDFGESPESVIRRLLAEAEGRKDLPKSPDSSVRSSPLKRLVESQDFQHLNGRDRYFCILEFLYNAHKELFMERSCGLKFGKRIQIARTKEEIESSGKSTFPEQVPGTDVWALTNLSNRSKRDVIHAIMQRLGYSQNDIRVAIQAIPDSTTSRSSTDIFINNSL